MIVRGIIFLWAMVMPFAFAAAQDVSMDAWNEIADEHAQEQIDQLSSANRALFVDDTLDNIDEPSRISYDFIHQGKYDEDYNGRVTINVNRIHANGRKDLTFRFLKGRKRIRFPPRYAMHSNPLFMLFLERDAREMNRITGGSTLFFRSRLRHSLGSAEAEDVRFPFEQKEVEGKRIVIYPFAEGDLSKRFEKYRHKAYVFIMSSEVPGYFYQLQTFTKDEQGSLLWEDKLIFRAKEHIDRQ